MTKKLIALLFFVFVFVNVNAQQTSISGKVTDQTGVPLAGATLTIKGTKSLTVTDPTGKFEFRSTTVNNPVLVISYVGYQTRQFSINGQFNPVIALTQDANSLNNVVVVGYGVQRKRDVAGDSLVTPFIII